MKKIITPVGLSLFTNCFGGKNDCKSQRKDFDALRYKASSEYEREAGRIKKLKKGISSSKFIHTVQASAEIASIKKIIEKFPKESFEVFLLPSDTIVSRVSAEIIEESGVLKKLCGSVENVTVETPVEGLQTQNEQDFIRKGMKNLVQKLYKILHEENEMILTRQINTQTMLHKQFFYV